METMQKIPLKPGPPVEGEAFYGRVKQLNYAWKSYILKGMSLLLSAPRRVGKSSFSKRMLKRAEEEGWKALYLDLQGISTEDDFVKLFKETLQKETWLEKSGGLLTNLFDSIKEIEVLGNKVSVDTNAWRNDTYAKIKDLLENAGEILIVVDELTIFFNHLLEQENGKEKVEFFLEWLRKFRQISKTKVRWIFCSSVGIENFASMHQLSKHLNDVKRFDIGAFTESEAKEFITLLDVDESIQFTGEDIQYILDKLGWPLPYFIQLLVEKINFLICVEDKQLSTATIDEAYTLLVEADIFNSWHERLNEYSPLTDKSRKVLKLCSEIPAGRSREDLQANLVKKKSEIERTADELTQVLQMLQKDGYLMENGNKYAFRSPLLRDFWYNKFIK